MTRKESAEVISVLQINYPDGFKGKSDDMFRATVDLWARIFADEQYSVVMAAVMAHMAADTNRFMPPVGVIKERIAQMRNPKIVTEQDAWGMVARAIKNGIYGADDEFSKLPEEIQRAVGSPSQLRDWAMMDAETVQSVVASNFQRSFRARQRQERDMQKLPDGVKKFIAQFSERCIGRLDLPEKDVPKGASGMLGEPEIEAIQQALKGG